MSWAEIIDGEIWIGCPDNQNFLAEQIPGCNWDKASGRWHLPLSWASYVVVQLLYGPQGIDYGPELTAWAQLAYSAVQHAYAMRQHLDDTMVPQPWRDRLDFLSERAGRQMFPLQRAGAAYLAWSQHAILNDDPGTGKTTTAITAADLARFSGHDPFPALVVAPGSTLYHWQREFATWMPDARVQVVEGGKAARAKQIAAYHSDGDRPADVLVMSWPDIRLHTRLATFPGLAFKRCAEHGGHDPRVSASACEVHDKELNFVKWGLVIADEAHRLQDTKSAQTRAMWWLMRNAAMRIAITGTMVTDNIGNLWPLLHGIDPGSAPAKSRYLDLFAIRQPGRFGGMQILDLRPDTAPAFHAIVQPLFRRVPREIALPWLPPLQDPIIRRVPMDPAQARLYKQLATVAMAELDGQVYVPGNTLVKFSRLCQLASANIELDPRDGIDRARMTGPSSKVKDLLDLLHDEPGRPLIVAANSPQLLDLAAEALIKAKITYTMITRDMSPYECEESQQKFQRGDCQVVLLTMRKGGEGITLTRADTVYFIQPQPSWHVRDQVIGRALRIGAEVHQSIRHIYAIAPGTVEERLYQMGNDKKDRSDSVSQDGHLMKWLIGGDNDTTGSVGEGTRPARRRAGQAAGDRRRPAGAGGGVVPAADPGDGGGDPGQDAGG